MRKFSNMLVLCVFMVISIEHGVIILSFFNKNIFVYRKIKASYEYNK